MHLINYFVSLLWFQFYFTPLFSQQVFKPFPQHINYTKGTIKPNNVLQKELDNHVSTFYQQWKKRYIKADAGEGLYYVSVEGTVERNVCVSEGQGYGMIIVAIMAGADPSAHKIYDGLFHFYKLHPSENSQHLMAWAQKKNFEDFQKSSAADGDLDMAYSLLLADVQWGSGGNINYCKEAQQMIEAIKNQEINSQTFSVVLSNAVEQTSRDYFDTRSSDFMPAHFKVFSKISGDELWLKVIDNTYKLFSSFQEKYSPDAGLLPDFIEHLDDIPEPARAMYLESKYDGCYNYNACRNPWRIATDYLLYGDKRAKVMVEKINKWIYEKSRGNPADICAGYTLEGDVIRGRNYEAMSFIAPLAVSAMVEKKNQQWVNKLWNYVIGVGIDDSDYFGNTIKMFNIIILSGNYWDPLQKSY